MTADEKYMIITSKYDMKQNQHGQTIVNEVDVIGQCLKNIKNLMWLDLLIIES